MKRFASMALVAALLLLWTAAPALASGSVSAGTPLGTSVNRISNIRLAAKAIDGTDLPYGTSFSFNSAVGDRTAERGYMVAINGRGVEVVGGGVAQVASTLYLALKQVGGIQFDELDTYGGEYNQSYVESSQDAVLVDFQNGKDFAFTNYADDMTISLSISGENLICTLTRSSQGASAQALLSRGSLKVSGNENLRNNIALAAGSISDTTLFSGDLFSFNGLVGPRTEEYGYAKAVNGRGVEVIGGGVAQVASVIWLAVRNAEDISIVEKSTYGRKYNQDYVENAQDAILVDYTAGTDFSFQYTGEGSITIYTYLSGDNLVCEIYRAAPLEGGFWADTSSDSWLGGSAQESLVNWW